MILGHNKNVKSNICTTLTTSTNDVCQMINKFEISTNTIFLNIQYFPSKNFFEKNHSTVKKLIIVNIISHSSK
jgi:hypothetical protein